MAHKEIYELLTFDLWKCIMKKKKTNVLDFDKSWEPQI